MLLKYLGGCYNICKSERNFLKEKVSPLTFLLGLMYLSYLPFAYTQSVCKQRTIFSFPIKFLSEMFWCKTLHKSRQITILLCTPNLSLFFFPQRRPFNCCNLMDLIIVTYHSMCFPFLSIWVFVPSLFEVHLVKGIVLIQATELQCRWSMPSFWLISYIGKCGSVDPCCFFPGLQLTRP